MVGKAPERIKRCWCAAFASLLRSVAVWMDPPSSSFGGFRRLSRLISGRDGVLYSSNANVKHHKCTTYRDSKGIARFVQSSVATASLFGKKDLATSSTDAPSLYHQPKRRSFFVSPPPPPHFTLVLLLPPDCV